MFQLQKLFFILVQYKLMGDISLSDCLQVMAHAFPLDLSVASYITAVFGLLLAFGWLFPQAELMLLFLPIPIKARLFVALYAVAELFLGVANFSGDNVAHFAHLGGMIFGYFLILYWKKKGKLY